jgi:hypothetical protein
MATQSGKKNFEFVDSKGEVHVFSSRQPRGAALKAASRGFKAIRLRERGTNRVHVFVGSQEMVAAPANRPAWLPEQVKKAKVKKQGVERV